MGKEAKVTIQVPMKNELHDKLKYQAESIGFDSVQAYIRFWATAETGDINPHGFATYTPLAGERAQALRYFELLLAQCTSSLSMKGYVDYVLREARRISMNKLIKSMRSD